MTAKHPPMRDSFTGKGDNATARAMAARVLRKGSPESAPNRRVSDFPFQSEEDRAVGPIENKEEGGK